MPVKKILIADDHAMTKEGMQLLIQAEYPNVEILKASTGKEMITMHQAHKPDIIITDYYMPEMNGLEAAEFLLKDDKKIKILMATMFDSVPVALNFLKVGGRGFISKSKATEHLLDGIQAIAMGDYYFSSENEIQIRKYLEIGIPKSLPKIKFTPLELAIIIKLSKGKTSKEIGTELDISSRTVETYRYDMIKKTDVKNSLELIEYVYKNGIV